MQRAERALRDDDTPTGSGLSGLRSTRGPVAALPTTIGSRRPTFDGRYAVGELIGRGGSASVYAARDLLLDRDVAVKMFTASADDPEELLAEEREARLIAGLEHRALTTIFDAGVDTTDPLHPRVYLVMERMRGGDLRSRLEAGALTALQIAWLGGDLAQGLQHFHEHGLVHRDIKPSNVLLAAGGVDQPLRGKLADFGISDRVGAPQDEHTMGTAAYLSPEQVEGASASCASDVYALGLVLLEALTGVLEFPGSVEESAQARLERDARIPEHLPASITSVLLAMLRRDPEDRPQLAEIVTAFESMRFAAVAGDHRVAAPPRPPDLDHAPNDQFDRVAHLATRLFDAPVAFVSLVDAERTRIRSCRGLDIAGMTVDPDDTICAVPDGVAAPWTIADVRGAPRLVSSALLVADPHLRAVAAAPLRTHGGESIGTLGVLDRRTRNFSPTDLSDLGELALVLTRDHDLRSSIRRALFPSTR